VFAIALTDSAHGYVPQDLQQFIAKVSFVFMVLSVPELFRREIDVFIIFA
jgi:hypothetical protein